MKIEISNGYVLMRETITRKIQREYDTALFQNAEIDGDGNSRLNPINVQLASESLVLNLIEKIVVLSEEKESFVEPTRDWLDNLPEKDFRSIENYAIQIKTESSATAKK